MENQYSELSRKMKEGPYCWQNKDVLRFLRRNFIAKWKRLFRNVYLSVTEIDSDFATRDKGGEKIKGLQKTVKTYSGITNINMVNLAMKVLRGLGFIHYDWKVLSILPFQEPRYHKRLLPE